MASLTALLEPGIDIMIRPFDIPAMALLIMAGEPISL